MSGLNENHQRRLRTTFGYIDGLLSDVERILSIAGDDSPFAKYVHDATPVQKQVISDYVARLRATMRAALEARKMDLPQPEVSAVWASRATLLSAEIALEELEPSYMRGYGEVSEEAARDLNGVISQLLDLLGQMESYLVQGSVRDLRARLKQFEQAAPDVHLLSELEGVITTHGLTELRATLEMLVERLESRSFEVAVFGRVSSGKSSLLNHILKTTALPVGVAPVTTVPLRITYGAESWGRAWFVDAAPEVFDLARLPEFATEQFNPSNRRHVTRIKVELPAPLLKDGVTFVDTPGLGSLAKGSSAESLAYLPRCDLGLVLIDAASTLTPQDIALVDSLHRAGADVMVLLSKADLLTALDRVRAETYVTRELETQTGLGVPVYLVSVKGADAALCNRWLEKALLPRLQDHQELAQISINRKLGTLQETVIAALEKRLSRAAKPAGQSAHRNEADPVLTQALAELDHALRDRPDGTTGLGKLAEQILDEAAHNAAVIWSQHHEAFTEVTTLLSASIGSRAAAATTIAVRDLIKIRALLENALATAGAAAGLSRLDEDGLPRPAGMPALDGAAVIPQTILRKPALGFLGTIILRRSARKQLASERLTLDISNALTRYEKQLGDWHTQVLNDLRRSFIARRDLIRARFDDGTGRLSEQAAGRDASVREDLQKLKRLGDPSGAAAPENARIA